MRRVDQANDAAAEWIIRRENGDWSDKDQAAFETWLAQSDSNKAAYWRLNHSWREADRIGSLGLRAGDEAAPRAFLRSWKAAALAASVLLCILAGAFYLQDPRQVGEIATARFSTPIGGREMVSLADGSQVELNTQTMVRTSVSKSHREVWLDDGEAFFEVAHNPHQQFIVHAGSKKIVVLGTKFSVRRDGDNVTVSVLEGRVRIDDNSTQSGDAASSVVITSGMIARSEDRSTLVTKRSDSRLEEALSWRDGLLTFDEAPLFEVAAEFNRYNKRTIVIADKVAGDIPVGGSFQASNVEAFARLLRDAYKLKVTDERDRIRISSE